MRRLVYYFFLAVVFCSSLLVVSSVKRASAQSGDEKIHKLEEVVVTATHEMRMIDMPASISIITSKDLEEMGAKNIAEALRKVPGGN